MVSFYIGTSCTWTHVAVICLVLYIKPHSHRTDFPVLRSLLFDCTRKNGRPCLFHERINWKTLKDKFIYIVVLVSKSTSLSPSSTIHVSIRLYPSVGEGVRFCRKQYKSLSSYWCLDKSSMYEDIEIFMCIISCSIISG